MGAGKEISSCLNLIHHVAGLESHQHDDNGVDDDVKDPSGQESNLKTTWISMELFKDKIHGDLNYSVEGADPHENQLEPVEEL